MPVKVSALGSTKGSLEIENFNLNELISTTKIGKMNSNANPIKII